ncbi:MAG TPA: helix-turn-helix domain-containing protein [Streptosporangiaceae bacterium]|nr:helix-turn-helix domain-containing protein [Streptosporangiaceae bacterium]
MPLEDAAGAAGQPPDDPARLPEPRRLTDARTMRALAHPVRIAIIEVLKVAGPMTATELGEEIGESPTTCSFHLRQLAKYGFVEEAGGGKGRARPWRLSHIGFSYSDVHDDPETEIAAGALSQMVRERQLDRYLAWQESRRSYPKEWREAANDAELLFYLTAEELEQLNADVLTLLRSRYRERVTDPSRRPAGAIPVEVLMFSFPVTPPPTDTQTPSDTQQIGD